MISLNDLASDAAVQNKFQEDTTLEDRLALEAEEDKKFGNSDNDIYSSARSSLSSQDATEVIMLIFTTYIYIYIYTGSKIV